MHGSAHKLKTARPVVGMTMWLPDVEMLKRTVLGKDRGGFVLWVADWVTFYGGGDYWYKSTYVHSNAVFEILSIHICPACGYRSLRSCLGFQFDGRSMASVTWLVWKMDCWVRDLGISDNNAHTGKIFAFSRMMIDIVRLMTRGSPLHMSVLCNSGGMLSLFPPYHDKAAWKVPDHLLSI